MLTEPQLEQFRSDGFVTVEALADAGTLVRLREAYEALLSREVEAEVDWMLGGITRQIISPARVSAVFDDNAALRRGFEIAEQLIGPARRTFDMLIYKPPGHPHATPWHQDSAYLGVPALAAGQPVPSGVLQFWVALDDVDEANGCMHFAKGMHKRPSLPHVVVGGSDEDPSRLLAIDDVDSHIDAQAIVAARLAAGGATIHDYGTPHFTPPNRTTDRPRRAYIFNLAPADRQVAPTDRRLSFDAYRAASRSTRG